MTLKCATFNTNSIRARLPIITGWLARERPDILCIQETKVQDKDFPVEPFEAAGYGAAFRGQKSYNGVAILSRLPLEGVRTELYAEGDPQARFISASVGGISVVNAYVPQGSEVGTDKFAYKLTWLSDLLAHLKETYPQDAPVIVAGDFNVALEDRDVFDPEGFRGEVAFHPDEQAILREFMAWGLVDVFRSHVPEGGHYTFWDYRIPNALKRKMGWRIDYILATAPLASKAVSVGIDTDARLLPKPSDHTFLTAEFEVGESGYRELT